MTFLVVLVAILAIGALLAWWSGVFATRRIERHLTVDGLARKYVAWLPGSRRGKSRLAVVLAFHGGFGTAEGFEEQSALHLAKQAKHFIIVYPDGYKRSWNAGDCCGSAMEENIDDRKFVRCILDDLETVVPLDRQRIHCTGFSNGARFCYYLAGTMSDVITAIAPAGGGVLTDHVPRRPVPILHMHGLEDRWAPYHGGASAWNKAPYHEPVEKGLGFWRGIAGTSTESRRRVFDGHGDCITYAGAPDGTRIEVCRFPGLGHHWPGTRQSDTYKSFVKRFGLGPDGPPVTVSDTVLGFFRAFSLDGGAAGRGT